MRFFSFMNIKPKEKKKILSESLKSKLNLEELTINLLVLMAENNRMKYLPSMARLFNKTMAFSRGEMTVNVTASSALDEATKKELQTILEGFAKGYSIGFHLLVSSFDLF